MFNIKRERGNTPPLNVVTTAGEGLIVNSAQPLTIAKPSFEQTKLETGATQYQITARDMGEARRILTGLKRKHPEIDVDALLKNTTITETYPQGAIHHSLSIGGELAGRSIVKSCLAMAIASGISRENCSAALQYLRQEGGAPCFGYYNENDLLQDRVSGMPLHCLAVRADAQSGLVLAYAEYFGVYRMVACLGDHYSGPLIEAVYALDPRIAQEMENLKVELLFSRQDIDEIYDYKRISTDIAKQAFSAVIGPVIEDSKAKEQNRVLERAVQKAFDTCGAAEGEQLTEEHMRHISRVVAEEMTPLMLHRLRPMP